MMEAEFWKWKGTYKYIDTMICCSEFMKSKMDSNPLFATKTVAMHNFIDKVEWKETEKKDYVLYFGRFSEEKGIGTLIKVCKELPDVQFIFAGTGPLEETVNGIKNIKNVGFQKGEALEKLIREARFSIYPSEWYENCPFSVMESQMYGTPVLGANIGGIPELIQVGKTGELFESGNGEDLRKKIEKLWGDKKLCEQYSKNCKDISFDTIDEYYENRTGTIAKILNEKQIPTPAAYHVAENHVYSEQKAWDLQRSHWTSGTVYHVLKNEKYKGTYVGAKFIMPVPCKHRVLRAPLEQQVRIEDSHAAIVTPEEFEQAQMVIMLQHGKHQAGNYTKHQYPLKGKVYCGYCQKLMKYRVLKKLGPSFNCRFSATAVDSPCKRIPISEELLEEIVRNTLTVQIKQAEHVLEILHERERKALICFSALERQEEKLSAEKAEIVKQRVALYEQYADGNISKEEFVRQRDAYRAQEDERMEQIQRLRTEKNQAFQPVKRDTDHLQTVISTVEEAGDEMHLSQNVVETFIDRIEVFNDERVKIHFTFEDVLAGYAE